MRVGILGGTFNPPHEGHLALARAALDQLGLDRVLLMPVATAPHKDVPDDPGGHVRAELCRLAVGDDARLGVSTAELDRGGTSYTVDTLRALRDERPGEELTLIVGADMAASLPGWREPQEILRLARVAVAQRAGTGRATVLAALAELDGEGSVEFFDMPAVDVSSSAVRARVTAGQSLEGLVPAAVAIRIDELGLYGHSHTS